MIPKEINKLAGQIAAESGKIRNVAARKTFPKARVHHLKRRPHHPMTLGKIERF